MPSERIQFLIQSYFADAITSAEMDELIQYVSECQDDDVLVNLLGDAWAKHVPNTKMPEKMSGNILTNVFAGATGDEKQIPFTATKNRVLSISSRRWIAAASVIAMLSVGGWYFAGKKTMPLQPIAVGEGAGSSAPKDILPGSQKAILTLANGTKIILDSAGSGKLARQGSAQIVKLSDNRVSYTADNGTAGEAVYNTMTTPRGGQYQLILSDGTKVWLNAASSIHYPAAFSGKERNVEISGEAYFEVAKNPHKPFVVKLNDNLSIRVLGTHFNVNSYAEESQISTTLLEGSIHMMRGILETSIVPGQQARVSKNGSLTVLNQVNLDEVTAWKNGYFQFNSAELSSVMRQVGRWYDIDVAYSGKIPDDKFSGKISMAVSLSRLKKWLEWSDVHFQIKGRKMIVSQ